MHLSRGEARQAVEILKASLKSHPRDHGTLTVLGVVYAATGDTQAAATQFNAALSVDKNNVDALLGLGDLEVGVGATDRRTRPVSARARDPPAIIRGLQQCGVAPRRAP